MKSIEVVRLVVDGEHCVALVNIDTVFGNIPFAEYIHVANDQIVAIQGYCDPRPMLAGAKITPDASRRGSAQRGDALPDDRATLLARRD